MTYGQFCLLVLTVTGAFALLTPPPAEAARSYDVLCISQTLPGGHPLPEVCVPYPL